MRFHGQTKKPILASMGAAHDDKVVGSENAQVEVPKRMGDTREFVRSCAFSIENAYLVADN